ncbi:MAG TPA: DUF3419 domain-containing protein, partial [Thermoanaerobaculia bacterium]|nr:DUF3419 domain-containing protein [Thermoanaerobaculia bacterium]
GKDIGVQLVQSGGAFCIASSGDTALALARRGFQVTAVDVNPAQIEYARARAAGALPGPGVVDRQQSMARKLLPWLGLRRLDLREFLLLGVLAEQTAFWHQRLDNLRLRVLLRLGLHKALLRLTHDPSFVSFVPNRFDLVILGRLERTWANHPNRENPYAWRLLIGEDPPGVEAGEKDIETPPEVEFLCADAAEYLASGPPGRFDGFTLSNVLDAAPPAYGERLMAAGRHAAAPGAVMVLRSFGEPRNARAAEWAARDRSPLWGSIEVTEID